MPMDNLNPYDFEDLLDLYLEGRETPEELELLMQAIASGRFDGHTRFVSRMLNLKPSDVHMSEERYNRILNKLRVAHTQPRQTPTTRTRFTWLLSAAAVVIAVATSVWLFVKPPQPKIIAEVHSNTYHGKFVALANTAIGSRRVHATLPQSSLMHLEYSRIIIVLHSERQLPIRQLALFI